jgi:hypothetical protein
MAQALRDVVLHVGAQHLLHVFLGTLQACAEGAGAVIPETRTRRKEEVVFPTLRHREDGEQIMAMHGHLPCDTLTPLGFPPI